MVGVDEIRLNFSEDSLLFLNIVIGLIMFGVALDLRIDDFKRLAKLPRGPLIGLVGQFLLLPALTFLLVLVVQPRPSVALGMMLVAACPGGNTSNFMTHLARGNTAMSIGMTAISTAAAIVMTPLNITFWASLNPDTAQILREVELDWFALFKTIVIILGIPLVLGMLIAAKKPKIAEKFRRPMRIFSILFFLALVGILLKKNWQYFIDYVQIVMFVVIAHNLLALGSGYGAARVVGLKSYDARAISIEVGMQNSALALILIFNFFDGLGGMAVTAAWWGIWHIISGFGVAGLWLLLDKRHGEDIHAIKHGEDVDRE